MKLLTNITLENRYDEEWGLKFHFEYNCEEVWFYKSMNLQQILQELLGFIKRLVDTYI